MRCLPGGQHDFWNPSPQITSEVQPGATAELIELHAPKLCQRFVFGQLACDQAAQNVPHNPSSTSRIRCQCVPAQ